MEPVEYLRIFRRRWWVLAAAFLISVVAVFVTTPAADVASTGAPVVTSYQATTVLLRQPETRNPNVGGSSESSSDLGLTAFYVTTGEVPRRVATKLGLPDDPALLAGQVRAEADKDLPAVRIIAAGPDGERAVQLASTFASELLAYLDEVEQTKYQKAIDAALARSDDLQTQLRRIEKSLPIGAAAEPTALAERDALSRQYGNAYERYQQLVSVGPATSGLAIVQEATAVPVLPPASKSFKPPASRSGRLVILGSLGLLLGAGAAILIERLDHRLRTKEQTEAAFGLPVVAEVPLLPRRQRRRQDVATVMAPQSMAAEAYRMLRTALLLMPAPSTAVANGHAPPNGHAPSNGNSNGNGHKRRRPQVILVTSPGPSEGKTTSTANLAASFAEMGNKVLVLSYDLRCPRIHLYLGLEEGLGLTDVLAMAPEAPDLESVAHLTDVAGVRLVTSGSRTNLTECIIPAAEMITEARTMAEIVLIDTSPLLTMADASHLVPSVDAVLLVARAGATDTAAARRSTELLGRLGAPVAGVALIGVQDLPGRPRGYYHDGPTTTGGGPARWRRPTPAPVVAHNGATEARLRAARAAVDRPATDDPVRADTAVGRPVGGAETDEVAGRVAPVTGSPWPRR